MKKWLYRLKAFHPKTAKKFERITDDFLKTYWNTMYQHALNPESLNNVRYMTVVHNEPEYYRFRFRGETGKVLPIIETKEDWPMIWEWLSAFDFEYLHHLKYAGVFERQKIPATGTPEQIHFVDGFFRFKRQFLAEIEKARILTVPNPIIL